MFLCERFGKEEQWIKQERGDNPWIHFLSNRGEGDVVQCVSGGTGFPQSTDGSR